MSNLAQNETPRPTLPLPREAGVGRFHDWKCIQCPPHAILMVQPTDRVVRAELRRQMGGFAPPRVPHVFHLVAARDCAKPLTSDNFEIVISAMTSEHTARRAAELVNEHFAVIAPLAREVDDLRAGHQGMVPEARACEFLRFAAAILEAAEQRLRERRASDPLTPTLCPYARFDARAELGALVGRLLAPAADVAMSNTQPVAVGV